MREITDGIINAELVDDEPAKPKRSTKVINLSLNRTKKYLKSVLDMPTEQAMKMLNDQSTMLLLVMNDMQLKWLEVLENPESDHDLRVEAGAHVANLINAAAKIAETRINLQKATGLDKVPGMGIPRRLHEKSVEAADPEAFVKKYEHLMPPGVNTVPTKDTKDVN